MNSSATWGFWGTLLWGVVTVIVFAVGQLLPIALYMEVTGMELTLNSLRHFMIKVEKDAILLALSASGSALLVVPFVFAVAKLKKGSKLKEYFDLKLFGWRTFFYLLGLTFLLIVFETFFMKLLDVPETPAFMMNIEYPNTFSIWFLAFAVIIIAPLVEEVIFRGFLLKGFSQTFMGTYGAMVLTSFLWAVIHMQYTWEYILIIFIFGMVFSYVRIKTSSLYAPMVMHLLLNMIAAVGLFYEKGLLNA